MSNVQIDTNKVDRQVEKRQKFHVGLFMHFTVFVVVNVIVWLVWFLMANKAGSYPTVPFIITGAWAVVLVVHGLIVAVAHKPHEVAQDEIKREIQQQNR